MYFFSFQNLLIDVLLAGLLAVIFFRLRYSWLWLTHYGGLSNFLRFRWRLDKSENYKENIQDYRREVFIEIAIWIVFFSIESIPPFILSTSKVILTGHLFLQDLLILCTLSVVGVYGLNALVFWAYRYKNGTPKKIEPAEWVPISYDVVKMHARIYNLAEFLGMVFVCILGSLLSYFLFEKL
ncbi:MAG: hypothetical protein AAGD25_23255 [Cyanobacteria bacterium P01_F01_bin.150]